MVRFNKNVYMLEFCLFFKIFIILYARENFFNKLLVKLLDFF